MLDLFKNPPADYRILPVWYWNARPEKAEVERQIREMRGKGACGFFLAITSEVLKSCSAEILAECLEVVASVAADLNMFFWRCDETSESDTNSDQVCPVTLYKSAHESAIGAIVEITSAGTDIHALQVNSGWLYDSNDAHILHEKLGVSAAHAAGLNRVLCTPFADAGWGITPLEMKKAVGWAAVMGANAFSPRPFLYSVASEAAPLPSHFYQSTYWKHWNYLSDYITRLSFALSQGTHKAQVALLNPIHTLQYEIMQDPSGASNQLTMEYFSSYCVNLLREHIDFDIITEETLAQALALDQRLSIQSESYAMLVLPPCTAMTLPSAVKIAEFVEDGGCLLGTSLLPCRDSGGDRHDMVREIFKKLFETDPEMLRQNAAMGLISSRPILSHDANVLFYECSDSSHLSQGLRGMISMGIKPEVSIRRAGAECREIIYNHRVLQDSDVFFFLNTAGKPLQVEISVRCDRVPYKLDPSTGMISALSDCAQKGSRTIISYKFDPHESLLMYFSNEMILPAVQHKCESPYEITLADTWIFRAHDHNCIALPFTNLDKPTQTSDGSVSYTARFSVDSDVPELQLVLHCQADAYYISVNGVPAYIGDTWHTDVRFKTADITRLIRTGANQVTFTCKKLVAPPNAVLMGDFSLDRSRAVLLPPRKTMRIGSWTEHAYPFYSGSASYIQQVEIPQLIENQRVYLRADNPAHIVEFIVNDKPAGKSLWPPYEVDITPHTCAGLNKIEIVVTNSSANQMQQEPYVSGLLDGARLVICS